MQIYIRGRESTRVPFGTGRAVRDIQAESQPYCVYDPRVIDALGTWQRAQAAFVENPSGIDWDTALANPALPDGMLKKCLEQQGALKAADKATRQAAPGPQLQRRLFEWNDAFRTLRLIHELRDAGLPSLPLMDAMATAPFAPECSGSTSLTDAWQRLVDASMPAEPTAVGLPQAGK